MAKVITTRKEWRICCLASVSARLLWIILIFGIFFQTYILLGQLISGQNEKFIKLHLSGAVMALAGGLMVFFGGMVKKRTKRSVIMNEVVDLAIITGNSAITAFMVITGFIIMFLLCPPLKEIESLTICLFAWFVILGGVIIGSIIPNKTELFLDPDFKSLLYEGRRRWVITSHFLHLMVLISAIALMAIFT